MTSQQEIDYRFVRLLRPYLGEDWPKAKAKILANMPSDLDPTLLARYVDESDRPSVNVNSYGVEPRFYAHRNSKRLLEFYPSK